MKIVMPNEIPADKSEGKTEQMLNKTQKGNPEENPQSQTASKDPSTETAEDACTSLIGTKINHDLLRATIDPEALMPDSDENLRETLLKNTQVVEEVAEDMADVLERLNRIETQQADLMAHLGGMGRQAQESGRAVAREMALLRDVVAGEQKGALTRGAFNAVVTCLDFVRIMKAGLDDQDDEFTIQQLKAVELSLKSAIQGLGFLEYQDRPR